MRNDSKVSNGEKKWKNIFSLWKNLKHDEQQIYYSKSETQIEVHTVQKENNFD